MSSVLADIVGRKVYPGDILCAIEEFIPGEGVYVDNGYIRAAQFGVVEVDFVSRKISVRPLGKKPRLPRKGGVVYGVVTGVPREELALVKIFADERMIPFNGFFTGVLHVSQVSDNPSQRSIYEFVKPGDFIRATVTSPSSPYVLSIKRPQDGVILAYCSVCGAPLYKVPGSPYLLCKRCGNKEKRKTAIHYVLEEKRKR
jgi:exosome complex component CSL4